MKKLLSLSILLLAFNFSSYSQITADIKDKTLSYFREYEQAANSVFVKNETEFVSFDGTGQPSVFRRKEKFLPDLLVSYFPKKDSTISYISYEWDEKNFIKDHRVPKQPIDSLKIYIDKYNELLGLVKVAFGEGKSTGSLNDLSLIETGKFQQMDNFSKNNIAVEMYIVLSNLQASNGFMTVAPTHRIRIYVRNLIK
jgi:hypothetical protein